MKIIVEVDLKIDFIDVLSDYQNFAGVQNVWLNMLIILFMLTFNNRVFWYIPLSPSITFKLTGYD